MYSKSKWKGLFINKEGFYLLFIQKKSEDRVRMPRNLSFIFFKNLVCFFLIHKGNLFRGLHAYKYKKYLSFKTKLGEFSLTRGITQHRLSLAKSKIRPKIETPLMLLKKKN